MSAPARTRPDRCPGICRPWPAEDGLLVRVRLAAGRITSSQVRTLARLAGEHGDGGLHPTSRANLQLRAMPDDGSGHLPNEIVAELIEAGLLPSAAHDLVRNVMCSPLTGVAGGRADLRALVRDLDQRILAESRWAQLPGKFLFVLDDGRGDLTDHDTDLGLVALDADDAQLRVGNAYGEVVPLREATDRLLVLAERFLEARGTGETAAWHVDELDSPLETPVGADPRMPDRTGPLRFGDGANWRHVEIGHEGIRGEALLDLMAENDEVVITPWYGVLLTQAAQR